MPAEVASVLACPRCGNLVLNTCYHEGDDVSSIHMPVAQALGLANEALADALIEVERHADNVLELAKLVGEQSNG